MIGKILGVMDVCSAILILLFQYNVIPYYFVFCFALYLIVKTVIFFGDFMSFIDGIVGLYMIIMIILRAGFVSYMFAIYLVLKGLWSIL